MPSPLRAPDTKSNLEPASPPGAPSSPSSGWSSGRPGGCGAGPGPDPRPQRRDWSLGREDAYVPLAVSHAHCPSVSSLPGSASLAPRSSADEQTTRRPAHPQARSQRHHATPPNDKQPEHCRRWRVAGYWMLEAKACTGNCIVPLHVWSAASTPSTSSRRRTVLYLKGW